MLPSFGNIPAGETLLTKHQARGTLLSQQSLAMSKHTIFIGKQGEETQQEIFFWVNRYFSFFFSLSEVGENKVWAKSCYCGD